jgi:nitrogenase molybdenum-cofactor synthesis protein NifE
VEVNQERHLGFAGYEGMANLVGEIDRTLANPIWAQLRARAPWDDQEEWGQHDQVGTA